jgi:hypothetical protein
LGLLVCAGVLIGATGAVLPALAATTSEAKLEVNKNCVEPNWPCWAASGSGPNPSPASRITITQGGEVLFADNSTAANIAWTGTAPPCSSGVPVSPDSPATGWEGRCKFEQPGRYNFESSTLFKAGSFDYTTYEIVVEAASSGTTTTTTSTASKSTTPVTGTTPPGAPHDGSTSEGATALNLAGRQRGSTVHGSIEVPQAASGGRLEVGLFTAGTSTGKADHRGAVRVGRLVRSSLEVGGVSFSVPLNAEGKTSLRRHRRLAVTVKIKLTPLRGAAVTMTRIVVMRT